MTSRIHYRLANDPNNVHALWSGAVTVGSSMSQARARRVIAKQLRVDRLPPETLGVTCKDVESGKWDEQSIRAFTAGKSPKAKKVKSFDEVPDSFDQVQDLMKKLGLA